MKVFHYIKVAVLLFVMTTTVVAYSQAGSTENAEIPGSPVHNVQLLDSSYLHKNILELITSRSRFFEGNIRINQSSHIISSLNNYISNSPKRSIQGFRIRIFFDNKQNARAQSELLAKNFSEEFPEIGVYRTYDNPYFKVTVGDLRTKSDAIRMLRLLEERYPAAFIVKDNINYPPL